MTAVMIEGWRAGLNKVRLNQLLRQYGPYGLSSAKEEVDRILEGDCPTFSCADEAAAAAFCREANAIGAVCRPVEATATDGSVRAGSR